jgi:hypothetical protein
MDTIDYEDLKTQRFVMTSTGFFPAYYIFVRDQMMTHGGFDPIIARFVDTPHDLIASIENNDEVAVCDMYLRDTNLDAIKCFDLKSTKSGLDAVWLRDNKSPYIKLYVDLVKKYIEEYYPDTVYRD